MRIYLASRYSRRLELLGYAEELKALGHKIVSSWISGKHELNSLHGARADQVADDAEKARWADEDLYDLCRADRLIVFSNEPNGQGRERGGYHVELGYALALRAVYGVPDHIAIAGPRVNVFHCLDSLDHFDNWEACKAAWQERGLL